MRRREFINAFSAAAALPLAARAQGARKVYRIGTLTVSPFELASHFIKAFEEAMAELGYVSGSNIIYEHRFAGGRLERLPGQAKELAELNVDVIVAGNNASMGAAKHVTSTIPIVATYSIDPIGAGFITSLARPGGNITGLTGEVTADTWGKRLELATQIAPAIFHVAVFWNPDVPAMHSAWEATESAARKLSVTLHSLEVRGLVDFEAAFSTLALHPPGALLVYADPSTYARRREIVAAAARNRIPDIYSFREGADDGGLMSYGVSIPALYRRASHFVDRILKGTKPSDLPVEQPTRLELVINLKAAKALGLTIPPTLLGRADEVIE
jgi:putative tryptophan/tyrosine transport system substrate-binding protein